MENINDFVSVARSCVESIHGPLATLVITESPPSYPDRARWRAAVQHRGVVVESRHASTLSDAVKALAADLASRSRDIVATHERTAFAAAVLGL